MTALPYSDNDAAAPDRQWSAGFIPKIIEIVGPLLLKPAPLSEDFKRATDLIILTARDMRIAARMRRPGYADLYPDDFTIRSQRENGKQTELAKIINGFGDWFFYGHADRSGDICRWMVIDLKAWRAHLILDYARCRPTIIENGDGTAFAAFNVNKFEGEPNIIVATSHERAMA